MVDKRYLGLVYDYDDEHGFGHGWGYLNDTDRGYVYDYIQMFDVS